MSLKKYFSVALFILTAVFLFAQGRVNPNHHYVRGYTRKDGTYVQGHYRTNPNSTNRDNYSTLGNVNPWTGKPGTVPPDNNPSPSYSTYSWDYSTPSYTPSYTPPARSSTTGNRSSSSSSTTYYDYSTDVSYRKSDFYFAGPKVIRYTNGKEYFNVLATDKTNFKPGLTYYYYDPIDEEVLSAEGAAYGQLLDGNYKFYYPDGTLSVESNYKTGLQHGIHVSYDENGTEEYRMRYNEGKIVYYRAYNDDNELVEWNGTPFVANSTRTFSKNGVVLKKEVYSSPNKFKVTEYDPESGHIGAEGNYENNELNGPFKIYHPENGRIKMTGSFINGSYHGIIKHYTASGALKLSETYSKGAKEGVFEVYGVNGRIIEKGAFKADELHGLYELYDPEEDILEKTMYLNGKANGTYEKRSGKFTVIKGSFLDDEPHGKWEYFVPDSDEKRVYQAVFAHYNRGKKNGPFKELHGDSILVGTYRNDLFHGILKIYRPSSLWLMGYIPEVLEEKDIITQGEYIEGKKTGSWRYYDMIHSLIKEGQYYNDKMQGVWKHYYPVYVDSAFKREPFSGKLYRLENYLDGKLNGKSEEFSALEKISFPCENTNTTANPDTCYKTELREYYVAAYFKNDELHGPYEYSKQGIIYAKGNYNNGQKSGNWVTRQNDGSIISGNYLEGKKHGVWKTMLPSTGDILHETTYMNDKKDGYEIIYHLGGKKSSQAFYRNGNVESVSVYDTILQKSILDFKILSCNQNSRFSASSSQGDTVYVSSYMVPYNICKEAEEYELFFLTLFLNDHIQDGPYSITAPNGKILIKGNYVNGKLDGTVTSYFYTQGVKQEKKVKDGIPISYFFSLIKEDVPFTGVLFSYNLQGILQEKIKIKNGLQNGKTEVYHPSGQVVKTLKFRKGVLIR